ncbi:SEC-C domain-containing protein [Christensenellaceae bacterium OttesenSCG-928-L17]|nr:SEC-C domain-containing protein [Christensenellaceae bacterium OttesenSCG-928-L17]
MGLYSDWQEIAQAERSAQENQNFWDTYFDAETENYKKILDRTEEPYMGTLAELADTFEMEPTVFAGFLDGINSSLEKELKLESLKLSSKISLAVNLEKLYFNMLDAKADWLYTLPQWETLLTQERRKEITKEFRASKMYVNTNVTGRNDPCPCGSGKKYKKCCGA